MCASARRWLIGAVSSLAAALLAGCAAVQATPQAAMTPPAPPLEVSLPGIVVIPATGEVRVEGRTCIESGIVEYLAVGTRGKAYESLFVLHCRPSHLQMAMLVAGYQEGELPPQVRGDFSPATGPATRPAGTAARRPAGRTASQPASRLTSRPTARPTTLPVTGRANRPPGRPIAPAVARPAGAPQPTAPPQEYWSRPAQQPTCVMIDVDVQQAEGSWQRRPIETLLVDRRTGRAPPRLAWAFTGSFFFEDRRTHLEFFAADAEQSLVALWYDPTALLNLTRDVGNPYRGDASGLAVDAAMPLKRGTLVRLVLHPVSRAARSDKVAR
jgi:hypothetical protein